ncbi:tyrosine-type recombinase/integrase [Ectothiorhodospira variabilis]|uniref:tyrosine-type recombinase/integrase n=1 Tax=Ectothiorhodospira variabilis TaxID=505694 RepID=UPI001EFBC11F|nr:tyrosine-type recombinase/integrase [Ectothiorhodospira variabilis]MCG5495967.1 tyrosine-type recombinase/integrase [Ectothiorhodospira variabilis]MCG5505319.1 tyrosine-type recombinase/integrase [Ectothiorhodospira variabilis]MCG5508505.1 tyrosine-type recombinase/integrase [Ectothiorhodospira variabilis]
MSIDDQEPDRIGEILTSLGVTDSSTSATVLKRWQHLLSLVIEYAKPGNVLAASDLDALRRANPKTRGKVNDRLLRQLLTGLNRQGWQCAVPPRPTKPQRPLAIPSSQRLAAQSLEVDRLERLMRREWTHHSRDPKGCLFLAALLLVTRCGASGQVAAGILSRLRVCDLDITPPNKGRIFIPIHGAAGHDCCHWFIPPRPLRDLLLQHHRRIQSSLGPQALLFHEAIQGGEVKEGCLDDRVRKILNQYLKKVANALTTRQMGIALPRTWTGLSQAGRWLARRHGVPPAILEILAVYPLPVAPLDLELHRTEHSRDSRRTRPESGSSAYLAESAGRLPAPQPRVSADSEQPVGDWSTAARHELQNFLRECERHCANREGGLLVGSKGKVFSHLVVAALERADRLQPSTRSVLHMALHWLAEKLGNKDIRLSTARSYVGRLFQPRLFDIAESVDMASWDDEFIEHITLQLLENPRWSHKTQREFIEKWMQFLKYCARDDIGVISPNDLPRFDQKNNREEVHVGRRILITPAQFDFVLQMLDKREDLPKEKRQELQAILALGFYGGLRASEILNLTVTDVVSSLEEFYVLIRQTKTPAGRRSVPLHRLVPDDTLSILMSWCHDRFMMAKREKGGMALGKMPMVGPLIVNRRPTWQEVIAEPIHILRQALRTDIDFHGLRHCAASWLVLRGYAAYHADIRESLIHADHAIFSDTSLQRLRGLFEAYEPQASAGEEKFLVHIAKIIGHANLRTLILTYTHTLGPIHSHALTSADEWVSHANRIKVDCRAPSVF